MSNITATLCRNRLSVTRHAKPLAAFWRTQGTQAAPRERDEIFRDSAATEIGDDGGVRPFEDIPEPRKNLRFLLNFYVKTEGFRKLYRLNDHLFAELGPIFKENIFGDTQVHLIDPDDFQKVFRAEGKYPRRKIIDFWKEHRERRNHFLGLGQLVGEEWHRARQSIAPKIMRPKVVEENIANFNVVANDAVARFVELKEACGSDDHIPDLEGELSRFATEGIGTVAFDARLGLYEQPPKDEALKFIEEVQTFWTLTQKLMFSVPSNMVRPYMDTPTLKKFHKCADTIINIGQGFVDKRMRELKEMAEKGIDPSDGTQVVSLLTYLLTKKELTLEEVNGHAIDVVTAGVDTSANTILWLLYNLARFPDVQGKLYEEVASVVGKDGDVTPKNIAKLPYLKACVKESARLTPVLGTHARILDHDLVLSGYNVPAETTVLVELYSTARSEKYFKDPLELKPERWLRENKDENHTFSSLPFGFGPRMCLGRRVAELEMYVFVCKLLQRFRLEYHGEPLELYHKLLTVPDKPVKIKFVDRL